MNTITEAEKQYSLIKIGDCIVFNKNWYSNIMPEKVSFERCVTMQIYRNKTIKINNSSPLGWRKATKEESVYYFN